MTQPSQQAVVPWNFFQGVFAAGTYTSDFDGSVDLLLSSLTATNETESTSPFVQIEGASGGYFLVLEVNPTGAEFEPAPVHPLGIVLLQPTALTMVVAVSGVYVSLDGYILTPPGGGLM